jgi:hypothetical protein
MKETQDRALTEEVRKARQPIGIAEVTHGDIHRRGPLHDQITHSYQFSNSNRVGGCHRSPGHPQFLSKQRYTLSVSGSLTSRHSRALVSTTRRYPRLSLRGLVISTSVAAPSTWGSSLESITAALPAGSRAGAVCPRPFSRLGKEVGLLA